MAKKRKGVIKPGRKEDEIRKGILFVLDEESGKLMNIKQIAYRVGMVKKKERERLQEIIDKMVAENLIAEPKPWKYISQAQKGGCPEGTIEITKYGYGFVSCLQFEEDIFIPPKETGTAFNGDTVRIELFRRGKGKKVEGRVVEVVQRARNEFVCMMDISSRFAFCIPDNPKIHVDFYVPLTRLNNARQGDKVVVALSDWPAGSKNPFAHVVKVLGPAGDHEVEMHAIIEEFGLPYDFPEQVIADADAIPSEISKEEIAKRKDFRNFLTFTIDPEDAKDFDDAISYRKIDKDTTEIGVHIADVTHYLEAGTLLDKEAYRRATSVYLVDRVIPMLPEKLSNFLCSLRPNEDKLCFSAVFELDSEANIKKEWFGKTIIHSDRRFTYEEVQEILEQKKGELSAELLHTNDIATKLRKKRYAEGSFSFETEEVKFKLDHVGKPLGVYKKIMKDSNMLIEDLMLLANRRVAEFLSTKAPKKMDFVYRVHDLPNMEKLANFSRMAAKFGYSIDASDNRKLAQSFNILLESVEGKPEQNILQSLAIRSMAKATYTTKNIGHYGLAFDYYTHFTSPIRRYPDVMVHRTLFEFLEKKQVQAEQDLNVRCKHSSEREVNAEQAERASIKYKQVEFMQDKIGEQFQGVISGVIESGLFVEIIENKCEGFVSVNSLSDDFYMFEADNYCMKGHNTKKSYTLGQIINVVVREANLAKRTLDFKVVEEE
ncbi:ribonuclease R [Bacteroidota bacterium]